MDEGCLDPDGSTQGPAATLAESLLGRARHSVRAGVVNQDAWVGNRGGQGTARPTRRGAKIQLNCHRRLKVALGGALGSQALPTSFTAALWGKKRALSGSLSSE